MYLFISDSRNEISDIILWNSCIFLWGTRKNHVFYNQLVFAPEASTAMKIVLDNPKDFCSSKTNITSGHLTGLDYLRYGDFEIVARTAHGPSGMPSPPNLLTCFSAINREKKSEWNEIALCWSSDEPNVARFSYW